MFASRLQASQRDGRCPDVLCECLQVEKSGAPPTSFLRLWPINHAGLRHKSQWWAPGQHTIYSGLFMQHRNVQQENLQTAVGRCEILIAGGGNHRQTASLSMPIFKFNEEIPPIIDIMFFYQQTAQNLWDALDFFFLLSSTTFRAMQPRPQLSPSQPSSSSPCHSVDRAI